MEPSREVLTRVKGKKMVEQKIIIELLGATAAALWTTAALLVLKRAGLRAFGKIARKTESWMDDLALTSATFHLVETHPITTRLDTGSAGLRPSWRCP
jgi:hypothetical protein